ncbi:MAG TPA: hypothetical protein DCW31_09935 [Lactobacillus sp.]|nr:hypothetical protein [Lactobacillus sp.]
MRKKLALISVVFLAIAVIRWGIAIKQDDLSSIYPIYAYNIPHGVVGWSFALAIVSFVASRIVKGKK